MVLDCYALSNLIKSLFHILAANKKLNEKKNRNLLALFSRYRRHLHEPALKFDCFTVCVCSDGNRNNTKLVSGLGNIIENNAISHGFSFTSALIQRGRLLVL